jgi:hypothetical protein
VRLVLARCQTASLPGLELSNLVTLDPVQLRPDRTVRVERRHDQVIASLTGTAPQAGVQSRVEFVFETSPDPKAVFTALDADDLGVHVWRRASDTTVTMLNTAETLDLPLVEGALRLYVRELEQFGPNDPATPEIAERMVFFDTVFLGEFRKEIPTVIEDPLLGSKGATESPLVD